MKKIILLIMALILTCSATFSQVKIGENTVPRQGAVLDLNSPYKGGLLLPNVDITDLERIPGTFSDVSVRNEDTVLELAGMVVWNTHAGSEGVYMWDGYDWKRVSEGKDCYGRTPETPGEMLLSTAKIILNETFTATVPDVDGVTYEWTLPSGLTGTSTLNSITILGEQLGTFVTGSIQVTAINECGRSAVPSLSGAVVTVFAPGKSDIFTGWTPAVGLYSLKYGQQCDDGYRVAYDDATTLQQFAIRYVPRERPVYWWRFERGDGAPDDNQCVKFNPGQNGQYPDYFDPAKGDGIYWACFR